MTRINLILRTLQDGPGTSGEIAIETGIPLRNCSALLSILHRERRVRRSPKRVPNLMDEHQRTAYMYELPTN